MLEQRGSVRLKFPEKLRIFSSLREGIREGGMEEERD